MKTWRGSNPWPPSEFKRPTKPTNKRKTNCVWRFTFTAAWKIQQQKQQPQKLKTKQIPCGSPSYNRFPATPVRLACRLLGHQRKATFVSRKRRFKWTNSLHSYQHCIHDKNWYSNAMLQCCISSLYKKIIRAFVQILCVEKRAHLMCHGTEMSFDKWQKLALSNGNCLNATVTGHIRWGRVDKKPNIQSLNTALFQKCRTRISCKHN